MVICQTDMSDRHIDVLRQGRRGERSHSGAIGQPSTSTAGHPHFSAKCAIKAAHICGVSLSTWPASVVTPCTVWCNVAAARSNRASCGASAPRRGVREYGTDGPLAVSTLDLCACLGSEARMLMRFQCNTRVAPLPRRPGVAEATHDTMRRGYESLGLYRRRSPQLRTSSAAAVASTGRQVRRDRRGNRTTGTARAALSSLDNDQFTTRHSSTPALRTAMSRHAGRAASLGHGMRV